MKNLKRRNVVLVLLVLFALAVSGTTYAYWASSVNGVQQKQENVINIGEGDAVTVSVNITDPQIFPDKLVPTTVTPGAGETNSIVVSYSVTWNEDALLDGVVNQSITASLGTILVGTAENPAGLISVVANPSNPTEIAMGSTVVFTWTVTMAEPANVAEYNAVANQTITFDITFDIA